MLKPFLVKTTHQKLLAFFAAHPGQPIHERELVRRTKLASGAVNRALNELHRAKVLKRERAGKTFQYALRDEEVDFRIFKVLVLLWRLDKLIQALREVSRQVILYGSAGRGTTDAQSDVDLLVVAPKRERAEAILMTHRERFLKAGLKLQPVVKTTVEWAKLEEEDPTYFREVASGVTIWEQPHVER